MGFSEIYLLGVDHNFSKMVDKNGNVIEDNTVQSHFAKDYNSDIKVDDHSIDGVGKDIDGRDLGNFYKRDSNLRGPYNDYFTVPYNPFLQ
jgi:hypothetical protein